MTAATRTSPSKKAIGASLDCQAPLADLAPGLDDLAPEPLPLSDYYKRLAAGPEPLAFEERPVMVDIKEAAAAALPHIEAICAQWLPEGKRQGHDWVARNPTRDDTHAGSFSVSLVNGGCIDHATGEACHDIVSTIKYLDGLPSQGEAARRLANWMGTAPIPSDPPPRAKAKGTPRPMKDRPMRHPKLGAPSATWDYLDASGAVMCAVLRFETKDKDGNPDKTYRPITRTPDGWIWKAPDEPRPLYGLDRLAARPDADVILCEGEKAADAAGILLPDWVAIACMNGAKSPRKSDWSPLAVRQVRIWPDADQPGADFAKDAAALIQAAGAASVSILDLTSLTVELPPGWDAADALADSWTVEQLARQARWTRYQPDSGPALGEASGTDTRGESGEKGESPRGARAGEQARESEPGVKRGEPGAKRTPLSPEQKRAARANAARQLIGAVAPVEEYPLSALGPLADAAHALADGVQVRPAMAGQTLLAVAAMLSQSIANVRTIESVKPLSLYLLTIAESGDGKSSCDTAAQTAIQARQRQEARAYLAEIERIESGPKGQEHDTPPPEPYRIARDGTVEGIRRGFAQGVPSQGVFSSEAAAMLAGYGMNPDNRAKSAATFNALWDDGELSVSRGGAGRIQLYDRRLSIHWLLQPEAANEAINDHLLSAIGFWPRFLIAWPEPSAPRLARPWRADKCPEIGDFWRACNRLLDRHLGSDCSDLPTLELSDEAMQIACAYFERLEQAAKGKPAPLRDIKPYAVRATEQALRIAGVLSVFSGADAVNAETMRAGVSLASYSLETWRGVFGDRDIRIARQHAADLFRWMIEQPDATASETAILRIASPRSLRNKQNRDTALSTLEHAGLATRFGSVWTLEVPE